MALLLFRDIPAEAGKLEDRRYKSAENLLESIERKKTELDSRHPLTEGEAEYHVHTIWGRWRIYLQGM